MSDSGTEKGGATPATGTADPASQAASVDNLMAKGDAPRAARPAAADARPGLATRAQGIAAQAMAEEALRAGSRALGEARGALARPKVVGTGSGASRRELALRVLLAGNLLLMVAMLFVPKSAAPAPAPQGGTPSVAQAPENGAAGAETTDPFVPVPRERRGTVPTDQLYLDSLQHYAAGRFDAAVTSAEEYLRRNPKMHDVERRLVYQQLGFYLVSAGRLDEARQYAEKSAQLATRAYLPEDLVASARRAEGRGDGPAMRRDYARFLLLQKQVPPSLQHKVAEAYLKLGDAYRKEADQDPARTRQEERRREERVQEGAGTGEGRSPR